jgi:predicted PurR-regulated permease PerM
MADDKHKAGKDNPGLKVVPARRAGDQPQRGTAKGRETANEPSIPADINAVVVNPDGEAVLLPLHPSSNMAQKIIAIAAGAAICYFGKPILVPIVCATLLGFILDPAVRGLERIKLPRALASFIVMLALTAAVWGLTYVSYVRVAQFVKDLPQYSQKIKESVGKVREQSQKFEKAKQAVAPDQPEDKNAIMVKTVTPGWETASSAAGSLSETFLEFSFVPVVAVVGLTWSEHRRRSSG